MLPEQLFQPVLDRLARCRDDLGGDVTIVPTWCAARPFSDVMRARVDTPSGSRGVFIKILRVRDGGPTVQTLRERLRRDFETSRRLSMAMEHDPSLSVVRPIACFDEHLAIVTEEVPGTNMLALLERDATRLSSDSAVAAVERQCENVGRWVRLFQRIEGGTAAISFDSLREYIDVRLRKLVGLSRAQFDEDDRARVLAYLDRRGAEVGPSDLVEVAVHADLAPANVIAAGDRVVVLDFTMTRRGARYLDVARFYAQLDLLTAKPLFPARIVGALQAALLRGFDPDLTDRRPLLEVLVLSQAVNHLSTLATKPGRLHSRIYNWYVRRWHRRWISRVVGAAA